MGERLEHPTVEQDADLLRIEVKTSTGAQAAVQLAAKFEDGVIETGQTHDDLPRLIAWFPGRVARPHEPRFPFLSPAVMLTIYPAARSAPAGLNSPSRSSRSMSSVM